MPNPEDRSVVRRHMAFPIPSRDLELAHKHIEWRVASSVNALRARGGTVLDCSMVSRTSTWVHNPGRKESPSKPGDPAELWECSASRQCLCHVALWICLGDMVSVASISQICSFVNSKAGLTRKTSCKLTDRRDVLLYVTSAHKCRSSPAVPLPLTFGMDVMKSIQKKMCINMKYFLSLS